MPFTKLEDTSKADFDFLGRNLNEKWSLWHRMSVLQCVSGLFNGKSKIPSSGKGMINDDRDYIPWLWHRKLIVIGLILVFFLFFFVDVEGSPWHRQITWAWKWRILGARLNFFLVVSLATTQSKAKCHLLWVILTTCFSWFLINWSMRLWTTSDAMN